MEKDGGGKSQNNGGNSSLSCRQMESLVALCDTFLPSINVCNGTSNSMEMKVEEDHEDDSVTTFYRTSASMAQTPQEVAKLITERLKHPLLPVLRLALTLLSTRIGTFILCGRPSLSYHFPYVNKFSNISQQGREEIARSWSGSYFLILRMLFLGVKMLTLLTFFSQVNNKCENLSWKAIDYPGPDPEFIRTKQAKEDETKEEIFGPLHRGIINLSDYPAQQIAETLEKSGFPVSIRDQKTKGSYSGNPYLVIKCDAVVVGSGSGGGVIAGVLAKAGHKVIVLERGSYKARSNLSLLEGPTMNEMYLGNGLLATADMGAVLLAGSTVGGGSTINWSASIRTPQHVLDEWSDRYGLELFRSELYKEALDVVCEKMGVQPEVENEGLCNGVLRKGCRELGFPVSNIPRNSPADHYCGWCCFGCKDGKKKAVTETWLMEMVKSGNGLILPQCEAVRVVSKKGSGRRAATGVAFEFVNRGGVREVGMVEAAVTVVACGALSTPSLLRKSGLKNPDIGKNLHIHPVTMAWGHFPDTPEPEKKSYEGGIMTAMSTVAANSATTGYGAIIQTPSLHPGMFSVLTPWVSGADIKDRMLKFSRTAHIFALARDKGSGQIASPSSISYKLEKIDEENIQNGIEKVLRILAAAGAEEIGTHHRYGKSLNVEKASLEEFERFVKEESGREMKGLETPICSAHQMGSCRMGVDRKRSAVNEAGETWEVEGLYVADSSVFPTALGVNPMVTVQAIAYCTAQSVLEALRRKKNNNKILENYR